MKQKDILFILLSSTFVVALWIVFSVLHGILSSTITGETSQDISQISGSFDTKTLQALKNRENVNPQTAVALSPTPSPTPTVPPITPVSPLQSLSVPVGSQTTPTTSPTPITTPVATVAPLGGTQ